MWKTSAGILSTFHEICSKYYEKRNFSNKSDGRKKDNVNRCVMYKEKKVNIDITCENMVWLKEKKIPFQGMEIIPFWQFIICFNIV